jgi:hypothetical protein
MANGGISLSWPSSAIGFVLEQSDVLDLAAQWQAVAQTPVQSNNQFSVKLDNSAGNKFFRLHAPLVTIAQSSPANGETAWLSSAKPSSISRAALRHQRGHDE